MARTASTILPSGQRADVTQTERIGPFLNGSVKVIEGRGYNPDGTVGFNAFGIISYQPGQQTYTLRSYALGYSGDFPLTLTADGYIWNVPAGPMTIRYTATIRNGTWREVGDRIMPGKDPVRFFEMNLKRVGDTTWPGDGAISPAVVLRSSRYGVEQCALGLPRARVRRAGEVRLRVIGNYRAGPPRRTRAHPPMAARRIRRARRSEIQGTERRGERAARRSRCRADAHAGDWRDAEGVGIGRLRRARRGTSARLDALIRLVARRHDAAPRALRDELVFRARAEHAVQHADVRADRLVPAPLDRGDLARRTPFTASAAPRAARARASARERPRRPAPSHRNGER